MKDDKTRCGKNHNWIPQEEVDEELICMDCGKRLSVDSEEGRVEFHIARIKENSASWKPSLLGDCLDALPTCLGCLFVFLIFAILLGGCILIWENTQKGTTTNRAAPHFTTGRHQSRPTTNWFTLIAEDESRLPHRKTPSKSMPSFTAPIG